MPSAGLCVRFLLYLTLIIYCPENFIIIFIKKSFPSNRIPIWYSIIGCSSEYPVNRVLVAIPIIFPFICKEFEILHTQKIHVICDWMMFEKHVGIYFALLYILDGEKCLICNRTTMTGINYGVESCSNCKVRGQVFIHCTVVPLYKATLIRPDIRFTETVKYY